MQFLNQQHPTFRAIKSSIVQETILNEKLDLNFLINWAGFKKSYWLPNNVQPIRLINMSLLQIHVAKNSLYDWVLTAKHWGAGIIFQIKWLKTNSRFSNGDLIDPSEVMIVDLQNTRLGRPGCELTYFFCSSTTPEQRKDHLDELLRLYYDEFFEQLTILGDGCDQTCYTFDQLKDDYAECFSFGFVMGCLHSHVRQRWFPSMRPNLAKLCYFGKKNLGQFWVVI